MERKDLVIFGPPGAGKGTQAAVIAENGGHIHLSTGDILREAVANKTPTGLEAKKYMESGELVPDEVVIGIIRGKLPEIANGNGVLFDGFPRTDVQARKLDEMLESAGRGIRTVVNLNVPDSEIVQRLSGRRVCACGATYHVEANPPAKEGVCDRCGGPLRQRKDDVREVIENRLKRYHEETSPLLAYYEKKGLLLTVAATGPVSEVSGRILEKL